MDPAARLGPVSYSTFVLLAGLPSVAMPNQAAASGENMAQIVVQCNIKYCDAQ
jgi:hypothetical protein